MLRVLVVEDEPTLRFLISDVLESEGGFEVVKMGTGDDAIMYLETIDDIDCVFTDVRMPGVHNGLYLANWIQSHLPSTKVLMTSGDLNPNERIAGVPFMPKPYDFMAVTEKIRDMLN